MSEETTTVTVEDALVQCISSLAATHDVLLDILAVLADDDTDESEEDN